MRHIISANTSMRHIISAHIISANTSMRHIISASAKIHEIMCLYFGRRCKVSFLSVFAEIMTHHLFLFPPQFVLGMPSRSCVFLRRLMSKLIFRFCTVFLDFFFLFSVFDPFLMCALVNPLCVCVDLCLICSFDFLWFPLNFSLVFCFFPCF